MAAIGMPRRALVALALAGCATSPGVTRHPLPPPAGDGRVGSRYQRGADPAPASTLPETTRPEVRRAVETAESLVGKKTVVVDGRDYGSDCSALVRAAFEQAGHPFPPGARDARSLHAVAERRGSIHSGLRCAPGDVMFLADRPGGSPEHVGLVSRVDPDGTATVLYRLARGVVRVHVNLGYPTRIADPSTGRRLNDTLVVGSTAMPAGSLVVDVASLL